MFCFGQSALSPLETSRCLLVLIKFTNKIIFNTNQITYLLRCCLLFVKSEQQSLTSLVHWIRRSRPQTDLQDIHLFHKTFHLWTRKDTQYAAEFKSVSPTDSPATGTRPPWQTGVFSDRQTDRQLSSLTVSCPLWQTGVLIGSWLLCDPAVQVLLVTETSCENSPLSFPGFRGRQLTVIIVVVISAQHKRGKHPSSSVDFLLLLFYTFVSVAVWVSNKG